METLATDPAFNLFHHDGSLPGDEQRALSGLWLNHVDDSLIIAKEPMLNDVHREMQDQLIFGSHDELPAEYLGLNIKRVPGGITVDQDHYVAQLQPVSVPDNCVMKEEVPPAYQAAFKSLACKLAQLGVSSRPDICFEAKQFAASFKHATKKDLVSINKMLARLKSQSTKVFFKDLGDKSQWCLIGYCDASYKGGLDGLVSNAGRLLLLCNSQTGASSVLLWRANRIHKAAQSSFTAEAVAMSELMDEIDIVRATLGQLHGKEAGRIPAMVITDCKDLHESLKSLKMVKDRSIMLELAAIKTSIHQHATVQEVRLVTGDLMAADGLTKKGRDTAELSNILTTGIHFPPGGGYQFRGTADVPRKIWASLSAMPKGKTFRCSPFATENQEDVNLPPQPGEIDEDNTLDFSGRPLSTKQDKFRQKSGLEEMPAGPRTESHPGDPSGGARPQVSSSSVKGESVPFQSTDPPLLGSDGTTLQDTGTTMVVFSLDPQPTQHPTLGTVDQHRQQEFDLKSSSTRLLARPRTESYSEDPSGGVCYSTRPTPSSGDSALAHGAVSAWLWGDGTTLQGKPLLGTGTTPARPAGYLNHGPGQYATVHNPSGPLHDAGSGSHPRARHLPIRLPDQARHQSAVSLRHNPQASLHNRGLRPANQRGSQGRPPRHTRSPGGLAHHDLLSGPPHHLQQAHHQGPAPPSRRPGPGGWYNFRVPRMLHDLN